MKIFSVLLLIAVLAGCESQRHQVVFEESAFRTILTAELAVAREETGKKARLSAEEVRGAVERVLSRPEFSDETPWWERLSSWIGERLDDVQIKLLVALLTAESYPE